MNKRRFGLVVAWVAATAMAMLLASQAVALVRDQVTDRPSRVATTLASETTTSTTASPATSTPSSSQPSTTTTGADPTTTAPTATSSTSQPVTTTSPATTTTTLPTGADEEQTYYLTGGWATVQCSGDAVALVTYAPNPGYRVEIESAGPDKVEIGFEATGDEHESKLEASCDDGILDPKIEEDDED